MAISTIEAHVVILLACVANIVTTVVGLKSLRRKLNGHISAAGKEQGDG